MGSKGDYTSLGHDSYKAHQETEYLVKLGNGIIR